MADGRSMVKQTENLAIEKARMLVEAADLKLRNEYKRWVFEAANQARKWGCTGKLSSAAVYETGKECRLLRRL